MLPFLAMPRGPLYMILSSAMFTLMVAFVKLCRDDMGPIELVFWRAAISTPILLLTLRGAGFRVHAKGALLARVLFGMTAMTLWYTAAGGIPVFDLNLIGRIEPILLALLAPLVLGPGERAGPRLWLAAIGGFTGCAIIVSPTLAIGSWFGVAALVGTLFGAGAHIALRRVATLDHGRTIVFWFHAGMATVAAAVLLSVHRSIPLPPAHLWWPVLGIGLTATAGQLLMTKGYSQTRAPVAAVANYAGVLWALIADLAIFGIVPGVSALVGGALVLGCTAVTFLERPTTRAGGAPGAPAGTPRSAGASAAP